MLCGVDTFNAVAVLPKEDGVAGVLHHSGVQLQAFLGDPSACATLVICAKIDTVVERYCCCCVQEVIT